MGRINTGATGTGQPARITHIRLAHLNARWELGNATPCHDTYGTVANTQPVYHGSAARARSLAHPWVGVLLR